MSRPLRIERDLPELVEALRSHVRLLEEYRRRAFEGGEEDFLGEVAGKLRLLVYESRTNKALLLSLIDLFDPGLQIEYDTHRGTGWQTLREYLDKEHYISVTTSTGLVSLKPKEFLALWAQQSGAAHEDWELNEELVGALGVRIEIFGQHPSVASLQAITNTVLYAANRLLIGLTAEQVKKASQGGS